MRIFLADLGHNLLTYSSDTYPLGVANIASYAQAYFDSPQALDVRIFRDPQDLKAAIDRAPPDVLGLSNYAWNEELSNNFAGYLKDRHPQALVCMGGPNYPLTADIQESFLRGLKHVDVYVDGPTYEGERAFLNLIQRYAEVGGRLPGIFEAPIPGVAWIHPVDDTFTAASEVERIKDLDEIPSPYTSGMLDPWFATGYFPLLQITRGCPFTCTYCNSGVGGNSRVYAHSVENVKQDLLYIADRIKPEMSLCFADDNFGMFKRDEEIADYIAWLQDKYNWPRYIRTTTGKNNGARIIRVMRKTRGALPMTAAVQSMNPAVLENIKRSNIKLETFQELQVELQEQGMQSYGELILSLPGESKQTFMDSVRDLLDAGSSRISAHQLMLLHGAEMATPESRKKFGLRTNFRVVARNIGNYTGEPVIEVEEMVVDTPTFPFEDYLDARVFHLLLTIFYYEGNFEEAFQFAGQGGVKPYDVIVLMQQMLDEAPQAFRQVIDEFVTESKEELFPTREDCLVWAREHYDELVDGTLGGNLLSKYSMLGRFFVTQEALTFLDRVIRRALSQTVPEIELEPLENVIDYLRNMLLHSPFVQSVAEEVQWDTVYDVEAWAGNGYRESLSRYRSAAETLHARVEPERRKLIETKVKTFGDHPSGLGKFTRTMFARDLRRTIIPFEQPLKA
jgi:radical SAM superfamily enzyme YgiQ (UPF0313 family)